MFTATPRLEGRVASCHHSSSMPPNHAAAVMLGGVRLRAMGEADWWLCGGCLSLNNLAARKCYSCRQPRPRDAVRASEYLGYVPVVSWDGKVAMHDRRLEIAQEKAPEQGALPPLRDPIPRDTLAVAPRPPHPARITYRETVPPPTAPGVPAGPIAGAAQPVTAVGPGPIGHRDARQVPPVAPPRGSDSPPWPHWRELLDGPDQRGRRSEDVSASEDDPFMDKRGALARRSSFSLQDAIKVAQSTQATPRSFIPWPEADRPAPASDTAANEGEPHSYPSRPRTATE